MVRGSASSLLRLCSSSRNDAFRFRVLSRNLILGSAGNFDRRRPESHPVGQFYSLQNRGFFSGLLNKIVGAGKSDSPKSEAETSDKINARASSSVVGDGDNFDNNSDSGGNGEVGFDKGDDLKSHLVGQFPSLQDRGVFSGLLNKISGADESDSPKPEVETSDKIDARVSSSVVGDGGGFDDNSDLGGNGEVGFDKGDDLNNGYEVMVNEIGAENGNGDVGSFDPAELYRELCDAEEGGEKRRGGVDRDRLQVIFRRFTMSGWASNQALAIYIGASFFPTAAHKFETFFTNKCSVDVANYVLSLGPTAKADKFLFPIFVEYCLDTFPDEIKRFRALVDLADLTKPHTWFPFARAMKRKIVYHCGPTNSGKTYNALQRFMEAKKGIYCSPLRLLAMEVFDKVNTQGVYCSLLTGQEQKVLPFSNHSSCTVEMASTNELYEVAVIDEIQMMSDPYRGYAWTRALLGLMADEIHLCGDPSVLDVVRKICSETGDELCEHHYDRFKPLVVEAKTLLGDIRNVRSGDCVVAFSRREIFEAKLAIEKYTKHRCSVIYGALPPETRRQQATLFNDQDNEFDVLVASDAVGMGLNLNIRRVVFYSLSKYNGDKIVPVPAAHVKQIAGRAGRRGSVYPDGLATTLHLEDLNYLIDCLKQPFEKARKVGLFPFYEQVELFAGQIADVSFSQLLEKFVENCRLDGSYFFCRHDNIKKVANMLEKVLELSLKDRFNFCFAPVNIRDPKAMYHLLRFASSYGQKAPVSIGMGMPKGSARNDAELLDLETKHQVLSMYLWLSNHFEEESFPYVKRVEDMATDVADLLGKSLIKANWEPESRNQARKPNPKKADGYERPRTLINSNDKKNLPLKEHFKKIVA